MIISGVFPSSSAESPARPATFEGTNAADTSIAWLDASSEVKRARVMIVDDEPINVVFTKRCLSEDGYSDIVATDEPRGVMAMIEKAKPDVILLDLVMPEVSGLTILSQLRSRTMLGFIPVIVVTGTEDENVRSQALHLGATDLLGKPIRSTDLLPRVRNALILKAHHDSLKNQTVALERQVSRRTSELAASRLELIHCLARVAEFRDNETGRHVVRVGKYSGLLAEALGLDPEIVELIEHAAPLHDIGKIGIPDAILLKKDKLSPEEYEIMQRHVSMGKRTFEPLSPIEWKTLRTHTLLGQAMMDSFTSPLIAMASEIALTHHERWDGRGYPLGLSGEDIPLSGRIVAVADVFDALSSKRPYKPSLPLEKCMEIMIEGRGSHFDPRILDAFLQSRESVVKVRIEFADVS